LRFAREGAVSTRAPARRPTQARGMDRRHFRLHLWLSHKQ
jgi:hypothetical protein